MAICSRRSALMAVAVIGRAIALIRTSEACTPQSLKTVRFEDEDIAAMEQALARGDIAEGDHFHLDFALGKG